MSKIKLGLIGAGAIARKHLEVINQIEDAEAVGITSRTAAKAIKLAKDCNIPIYADTIDSLVKKAKPDALMVLVSADQIYKVCLEAIPYGLPLFIEKPAGMIPDETKLLAESAKRYSVTTMVGYNRRYYSIFHKGIDIIKRHGPLTGVFVEGHERIWLKGNELPERIRSQWIFANSTHTIDLLRFFGGEPTKISSIAHRYIEPRGDQFAAVMELESGAIGQYSAHWYSPGGWRVVLYGQGVTVEFKPLENGRWIDKNFNTNEILPDETDLSFKAGFYGQMRAFARLVRDGIQEWPALNLDGAYKTMILAQELTRDVLDKSAKGAR